MGVELLFPRQDHFPPNGGACPRAARRSQPPFGSLQSIDPAQGAGTTSVFKSCNFPSFLKDRFTERQCTNREMHTSQCTALWVVSNASSCVTTTTAKTYPQFYRLRLPQHLLCVNPSRAFWSVPANFVEITSSGLFLTPELLIL